MTATDSITEILDKLIEDATDHYYSRYTRFDWVDELADEQWWMSPDPLSIAATAHENSLEERTRMLPSKCECVNFFSLKVHRIRELLIEVTRRIHMPSLELPSDFFPSFPGRGNGHMYMWFFAQFSRRYGKKLYPDKALRLRNEGEDAEIANFLVFARILIFEELVDYCNIHMGRDSALHPLIRDINQVHHKDQRRHIVIGRKLVDYLYRPLRRRNDPVTGETMLWIGAPLANRATQFRETIGLFMHACPLPAELTGAPDFRSLTRQVQLALLQAVHHEVYPVPNPADNPKYDVYFNFQNTSVHSFDHPVEVDLVGLGRSNHRLALQPRDFAGTGAFQLDFDFNVNCFAETEHERSVGTASACSTCYLRTSSTNISVGTTSGMMRSAIRGILHRDGSCAVKRPHCGHFSTSSSGLNGAVQFTA